MFNFMKKILILFITIITLTGCDYNPKQEELIKIWKIIL